MSLEAEFVEVRFYAYVSSSFEPKIVIWAYLVARTPELSDSKARRVLFTISKGFMSSDAEFLEVQFFAFVSSSSSTTTTETCSLRPKIVILA